LFSDKQKANFLKEISPIKFTETQNYKNYYKSIWEESIKLMKEELERYHKCIEITEKNLKWYKEAIEE